MDKDWYTYKEIIELFQITSQTLNNWRRNGTIIYKKFNQRTFLYQLPENKSIQENGTSKSL
jgi:predicted site-specific integrase-resolvase